jgi:hypothetical protein
MCRSFRGVAVKCLAAIGMILLTLGTYSEQSCRAETISLGPIADRSADDANRDGVWDTWQPLNEVLLAYHGTPTSYNDIRAALEFDMASIPAGSTINSATLKVRDGGASDSHERTLQFNSYVGNGVLEFADFAVNNQIGPLYDPFGPDDHSGYYNVPATSSIQSLIQSSSRYAGFMIRNISQSQTAFKSSRTSSPADRPALVIDYTLVPEPSAFGLIGTSALCLLALWHRRRRPA